MLTGDVAFIYILYKWQNNATRQSGKLKLTWPLPMVPDVYLGSAFIWDPAIIADPAFIRSFTVSRLWHKLMDEN